MIDWRPISQPPRVGELVEIKGDWFILAHARMCPHGTFSNEAVKDFQPTHWRPITPPEEAR